jgi:hypothetical protein
MEEGDGAGDAAPWPPGAQETVKWTENEYFKRKNFILHVLKFYNF